MREYISAEKLKNLSRIENENLTFYTVSLQTNAESVELRLQPLWEEAC